MPPLFFCHGNRDELVPVEYGQSSFNHLQSLGISGQFHIIKNALHEMKTYEIDMLYEWINERVPPS